MFSGGVRECVPFSQPVHLHICGRLAGWSTFTPPTYSFGNATTMGNVTSVNLQSCEATTTSWGYTTPIYERNCRAIAIRYIEKYPETHFLINGHQMTAEQLREYYYANHPDQKGRELLVNSVTFWITRPHSGTLDQGL